MKPWPELKYEDWAETAQTLHMWTQIVGKIRMSRSARHNHWWHVTLYVTSRGLGTSPIPSDAGTFEIEFDFIHHRLRVTTSEGANHSFKLEPMSVAVFYERITEALSGLGIETKISTMPSEVEAPIEFSIDTKHCSYDPAAVERFWRVLIDTSRVLSEFRSDFLGKSSPIHFFWGAIDLAMTRFSGREAPLHPGAPGLPLKVVREGYSHEVSSAGFWPGGSGADAAFYSYAYPEPKGYAQAAVTPAAAFYSTDLREFLLPYSAVQKSTSPDETLLEFLRTTYAAAADLGRWDRKALERPATS